MQDCKGKVGLTVFSMRFYSHFRGPQTASTHFLSLPPNFPFAREASCLAAAESSEQGQKSRRKYKSQLAFRPVEAPRTLRDDSRGSRESENKLATVFRHFRCRGGRVPCQRIKSHTRKNGAARALKKPFPWRCRVWTPPARHFGRMLRRSLLVAMAAPAK